MWIQSQNDKNVLINADKLFSIEISKADGKTIFGYFDYAGADAVVLMRCENNEQAVAELKKLHRSLVRNGKEIF